MQKLLLESEVAAILRCKVSKVQRLRRTKKLKFIPGRPVTIDEADLLFYLDCMKRQQTMPNKTRRTNDDVALRARQKAIRQMMRGKR